MRYRRQRARLDRPPVHGRVGGGVGFADEGDVVAADDVQTAQRDGFSSGRRGKHALRAVGQHQVGGLVEAAQRADEDAAVVANDGDDGW